jgi:hypothetical protein
MNLMELAKEVSQKEIILSLLNSQILRDLLTSVLYNDKSRLV